MLVPLIFLLVLSILINRTAKQWNVSGSGPQAAAALVFIVFVLLTRGLIRVPPGRLAEGIFLAVIMYVIVTVLIFVGAALWIKKKAASQKPEQTEDK